MMPKSFAVLSAEWRKSDNTAEVPIFESMRDCADELDALIAEWAALAKNHGDVNVQWIAERIFGISKQDLTRSR